MDVHHINPRMDGGSNEPDNLVALCTSCHGEIHNVMCLVAVDVQRAAYLRERESERLRHTEALCDVSPTARGLYRTIAAWGSEDTHGDGEPDPTGLVTYFGLGTEAAAWAAMGELVERGLVSFGHRGDSHRVFLLAGVDAGNAA